MYISDDEVKTVPSPFGDIKGEIIQLKYKAKYNLPRIEKGMLLVQIVLYSLTING